MTEYFSGVDFWADPSAPVEQEENFSYKNGDIGLTSDQSEAADRTTKWLKDGQRTFVLAGAAGTGKTTLLGILRKSFDLSGDFILASFTGKAASVLSSKFPGAAVRTLHSLLYIYDEAVSAQRGYPVFFKKPEKVFTDLLIVDEAYMLNDDLYQDIMATGAKKVLFVGDPFQLPPIDGVNPERLSRPDAKLLEVTRTSQNSPIAMLAEHVRTGGALMPGEYGPLSIVRQRDSAGVDLTMFDKVLCYTNATRRLLNKEIRDGLGLKTPYLSEGDRIVCLKNSQGVEGVGSLYNGLEGIAHNIRADYDKDSSFIWFDFKVPGRAGYSEFVNMCCPKGVITTGALPAKISGKENYFTWAYATTCHKAQGSEYDRVLVLDESGRLKDPVEKRQWLYTAVTRAQRELTIITA